MKILKQIQAATEPETPSAAYRAKADELTPYYRAVEAALSQGFMDDFCGKQSELARVEADEAFARGFRTGGQLMLAVLSRYSS